MARLDGTMLGDFQVLKEIGHGGMGSVYLARQTTLDREVAIKVLPAALAVEPGFRERFIQEARAIARLEHRNILPIYEYGEQDGLAYIVMPYIRGGSLSDRLHKGLPHPSEIARYLDEMAAALDYAHTQGIIHRDVKPANILAHQDGHLLLSDFGLSKTVGSNVHLTRTGMGVGTAEYMAPEQAQGKATPSSDIYSLAVILYRMLTGSLPFDGPNAMDIIIKHTRAQPPPPRMLNRAIPTAVEQVVLTALAKTPAQRFPTAGALAQAYRLALAGRDWKKTLGPVTALPRPGQAAGIGYDQRKRTANPLARPPAPVPLPRQRPAPTSPKLGLLAGGIGVILLISIGLVATLGIARQRAARNVPGSTSQVATGTPALREGTPDSSPLGGATPTPSSARDRQALSPSATLLHTFADSLVPIVAVAWAPDGKELAAAGRDNIVQIYDARTYAVLLKLAHAAAVTDVSWSPDGTSIATASTDNTAAIWDATSGKRLVVLAGHTGRVTSVSWSPDSARLATASTDKTVRIWSANGTIRGTLRGHTETINQVIWSPTGSLLASSGDDAQIIFWNAHTLARVNTFSFSSQPINSLAWSPQGSELAVGSADGTTHLIITKDVNNAAEVGILAGQTDAVLRVAWSHDGNYLASASKDRTVMIWDVKTGQQLATLNGHTEAVVTVAWAPNSTMLASGGLDRKVLLWQIG